MERRIDLSNLDLDEAAGVIAARRPGWVARGLTVHAVTWVDHDTEWPRPLVTERSGVNRPRSLGLRLDGEDGAAANVVVYAGGWAEFEFMGPAPDEVVVDYVELGAPREVGALLDRLVPRLTR